MFGEYDSESPRVPSPWDSLISSPRSGSPSKQASHAGSTLATKTHSTSVSPRQLSPSPLLLPRLVPENDSGNVEYKLQLLNPSSARFTRLVTQLKWRLLEGGGQAYYELGVADSGDLVGLGRSELESSLDTLEMMAGEIGASVIVVKEIEVPAQLAERYEEDVRNNGGSSSWGDARGKPSRRRERGLTITYGDDDDVAATSTTSLPSTVNSETEEESGVAENGECGDMEMTVILQASMNAYQASLDLQDSVPLFSMDLEVDSDIADATDISETDEDKSPSPPQIQYAIDLEISSVYKPRPMRKRFHHIHPGHYHGGAGRSGGVKGKKEKEKQNHNSHTNKTSSSGEAPLNKPLTRRQARDRRREERKQMLTAASGVTQTEDQAPTAVRGSTDNARVNTSILVEELEALHVGVKSNIPASGRSEINTSTPDIEPPVGQSDIVAAGTIVSQNVTHRSLTNHTPAKLSEDDQNDEDDSEVFAPLAMPTLIHGQAETKNKPESRLIVEVLVVRKMSIEEGFLDFEGFSLT